MNREQDAYNTGRRAALRGETPSKYQPGYRKSKELWTRFQLGYMDASKELARAKKEEAKK